ncbi:MAG: PTS sugar transporter subunit IIA [Clostridium sp.]|nr:PTS sugar transporter subunit IIA [Clostridium sp.]
MLYERCVLIIKILLQSGRAVTAGKLAEACSVSSRTIRSDLDMIDQWLAGFSHEPVVRVPGRGVLLSDRDGTIKKRLEEKEAGSYVMSSKERVRAITGIILAECDSTSIAEMAEELQVSGATISNDLQKVKAWMDRYCIHMVSKPHVGIAVRDSENNIRRGCVMLLREILETGTRQQELIGMGFTQAETALQTYRMVSFCNTLRMWREEILLIIKELQERAQVTISDNGFCAMFLYLLTAFTRMKAGHSLRGGGQLYPHVRQQQGFAYKEIHQLIREHTGLEADEDEMFLIHAEWMSLRKFGSSHDINVEHVLIAKELIAEVKDSLEIEFQEGDDTVLELATHLSVMQYRLFLNIPAEHNPALVEIEESFPDVCQVVKQKLWSILKERMGDVNREVCSQEAVYIAMYIVACILKNPLEGAMKKDVVIVCNSTIATSKILENRLKSIFYNVNVVKTISYHEFVNTAKPLECDLIISTLPLESSRYQCITVNPLLKLEDVNRLMSMFMLRMQNVDLNKYISATINIAARSLKLKPEERIKLSIELARNIKEEVKGLDSRRKPALRNLLNEFLVAVNVKPKNCYEAIQMAGDLLKLQGHITQKHIDEMIKIKRKLGGYMVIDKGVALPHLLAPELPGPCMSVITLDKPVKFNNEDNDPVDLVIMLLSNDNTAHIKVLEELLDLLGDERKREAIRETDSVYELLGIIS